MALFQCAACVQQGPPPPWLLRCELEEHIAATHAGLCVFSCGVAGCEFHCFHPLPVWKHYKLCHPAIETVGWGARVLCPPDALSDSAVRRFDAIMDASLMNGGHIGVLRCPPVPPPASLHVKEEIMEAMEIPVFDLHIKKEVEEEEEEASVHLETASQGEKENALVASLDSTASVARPLKRAVDSTDDETDKNERKEKKPRVEKTEKKRKEKKAKATLVAPEKCAMQ